MTSRVLPPAEWSRLEATGLAPSVPLLAPTWARIVVVEDAAGEIIGSWAVQACLHGEGAWIAPAHRKRAAVARRLVTTMRETIAQVGARSLLVSASSPEMHALLRRHTTKPPIEEYALCLSPI